MDKFEYDFRGKTEDLIVEIKKQTDESYKKLLQENPNLSDKELLEKRIAMAQIDSINTCASLLADYHKNLISYIEQLNHTNA